MSRILLWAWIIGWRAWVRSRWLWCRWRSSAIAGYPARLKREEWSSCIDGGGSCGSRCTRTQGRPGLRGGSIRSRCMTEEWAGARFFVGWRCATGQPRPGSCRRTPHTGTPASSTPLWYRHRSCRTLHTSSSPVRQSGTQTFPIAQFCQFSLLAPIYTDNRRSPVVSTGTRLLLWRHTAETGLWRWRRWWWIGWGFWFCLGYRRWRLRGWGRLRGGVGRGGVFCGWGCKELVRGEWWVVGFSYIQLMAVIWVRNSLINLSCVNWELECWGSTFYYSF